MSTTTNPIPATRWERYADCDRCGARSGLPCWNTRRPLTSRPGTLDRPHKGRTVRRVQATRGTTPTGTASVTLGWLADHPDRPYYQDGNGPIEVRRLNHPTRWNGANYVLGTELPDEGRTVYLDVNGPYISMGETQPAAVNWSALGSTSPTDALCYATLLKAAAYLAYTAEGPLPAEQTPTA